MKTLHRIRYDINIYFANFQAWVIIGFLEMGIFIWVPDHTARLGDSSISACSRMPNYRASRFLLLATSS